jgi:phosphotriesterase-related protein
MSKYKGKILTTLGPIEPKDLGTTLMHEHLLVDLRGFFKKPKSAAERKWAYRPVTMSLLGQIKYDWFKNLDNLFLLDERASTEEVLEFKRAGGNSIVDTTPNGIGRNPRALERIALETGLNIIMGSGYYVGQLHPRELSKKTVNEIADEIIRDVNEGIDDTGVHSGIIGEIGNSHPWIETERKVVRASARAQQETGVPLTIHPGRHSSSPFEIIALLEKEGADLSRVIIGHVERTISRIDRMKDIADKGCCLEFDLFGIESYFPWTDFDLPNDAMRIKMMKKLIDDDYTDRLVVSQDVCMKYHLSRYGGFGYGHILKSIAPRMLRKGVTRGQLHAIMAENPRRLLTIAN